MRYRTTQKTVTQLSPLRGETYRRGGGCYKHSTPTGLPTSWLTSSVFVPIKCPNSRLRGVSPEQLTFNHTPGNTSSVFSLESLPTHLLRCSVAQRTT